MARTADHEQRRRQVAEAVLRITAQRGLDDVSLAKVAAEAGVSVGLVQHYFATKDAMMLFAFRSIADQFSQRAARIPRNGPLGRITLQVLAELLPLDEQRAAEVRIWLGFCAHAAFTPALATVQAEYLAEQRRLLAATIREAQARGESPPDLDPEREGALLAAFVDGLANQAHNDPAGLPSSVLESLLAAYLRNVFNDLGDVGDAASAS